MLIVVANVSGESQLMIDVQGHRGCRGVLPENTVEGFVKALEVGVTTLEMDVVISKDKKVVVSHEPYFAHEISTAPDGTTITEGNEKQHNIYQLTYDEIKRYDVGLKEHRGFPSQKKIPAYKPLLSQVLKESEAYVDRTGLKKPHYNIEIKRKPEEDSEFHPPVDEFTKLVVQEVYALDISERVIIQSFDMESLQYVKQIAPDLRTALLIENDNAFRQNIMELGYTPDIYSPDFKLVSSDLVMACKDQGVLLIPWTVNEKDDMLRMIQLQVDGIITDYPEELIELIDQMNVERK